MKKYFILAAFACLALFFVSCDKQGVPHTGDETGTLYGIWYLKTKTDVSDTGTKTVDYSGCHFYLSLSEFPFPNAIGKKGSFTNFDLNDVDVDAVRFTYNAEQKKISFSNTIWLTDELLTYSMLLSGTFDVVELNEKTLALRQENGLLGTTTTYTYERMKQ